MAADPMTRQTVDNLLFQDDEFDFDDDPFADRPQPKTIDRDDKAVLSPRKRKADDDKENFGLGLDEEVKITKKRKPIAKLDTEKLLSQPGIPKVREVVRSHQISRKLKLKGKGHEFSDCARLLNYYQLWADNMYPRAKFADALQLIEKAGHTKRMQVMRRAWIDESKPSYLKDHSLAEDVQQQHKSNSASGIGEQDVSNAANRETNIDQDDVPDDDAMFFADARERAKEDENTRLGPDDDELDELLAQEDDIVPPLGAKKRQIQRMSMHEDSEGEDDLDALLAAEQDLRGSKNLLSPTASSNQQVESQDDLDAILNENDSFELQPISRTVQPVAKASDDAGDETEDELDALLNEEDSFAPTSVVRGSSSAPSAQKTNEDGQNTADHPNLIVNSVLSQQSSQSEPDLPQLPSPKKQNRSASNNDEPTLPGSSEVPELTTMISSSPIPNIHTDDLDALMDEMDNVEQPNSIGTPSKGTQTISGLELGGDVLSSSPIPNEHGDSQ